MLPAWMPWIRKRFGMGREMEREFLAISPRQMDRRLRDKKLQARRRLYGRTQPGLLLKHQIAVQTESWDRRWPGFTEIDMVSHSGNCGAGEFGPTLKVADIHSTWTESRDQQVPNFDLVFDELVIFQSEFRSSGDVDFATEADV